MVASGVQVLTDSGENLVLDATQEVILAAGTYRTPALLEYSGVGNPRSAPSSFKLVLRQFIADTNTRLGYYQNTESILP